MSVICKYGSGFVVVVEGFGAGAGASPFRWRSSRSFRSFTVRVGWEISSFR